MWLLLRYAQLKAHETEELENLAVRRIDAQKRRVLIISMKAYDLGKRGVPLLHKFLDGGDKLALALKKQDLSTGRVFTFIPDAAQIDKISVIEGGLSHFPWDQDFCRSITRLVEGYLERPQSAFVMELQTTSRELAGSLFEEKPYTTFFSEGSSHVVERVRDSSLDDTVGVYGYTQGQVQSDGRIVDLIADRRPFAAIGALTSFGSSILPVSMSFCGTQTFKELGKNADYIVASAYDDEGWIIWAQALPE